VLALTDKFSGGRSLTVAVSFLGVAVSLGGTLCNSRKLGNTGLDVAGDVWMHVLWSAGERNASVTLDEEGRGHSSSGAGTWDQLLRYRECYSDARAKNMWGGRSVILRSGMRSFWDEGLLSVAQGPNAAPFRGGYLCGDGCEPEAVGMDYVDLYQIHRWDTRRRLKRRWKALHDLVKAGRCAISAVSIMRGNCEPCIYPTGMAGRVL